MVFNDNLVYIANEERGLSIINVYNKLFPNEIGRYDIFSNRSQINWTDCSVDLFLHNKVVFLCNNIGGMDIINVTIPTNPHKIGFINGTIKDITVDGNIAYLIDGSNLELLNVTDPNNITKISTYEGMQYYSCLFIWKNHVYISGRTIEIIDISDPNDIYKVAEIDNGPRRLMIDNDFLYYFSVDELKVFDISRPNNPKWIGPFANNNISPSNFFISEKYIFLSNSGGFRIIDRNFPPHQLTKIGYYASLTFFIPGTLLVLLISYAYAKKKHKSQPMDYIDRWFSICLVLEFVLWLIYALTSNPS